MHLRRTPVSAFGLVFVAASLLLPTAFADVTWHAADNGTWTLADTAAQAPQVTVRGADETGLDVSATVASLALRPVDNAAGRFVEVTWPDAGLAGDVGAPALPVMRRLFVAPPDAQVTWQLSHGEATVLDLTQAANTTWVIPRQPPIEKVPGALADAAFALDATAYSAVAAANAPRVSVQELGIIRDQHLWLLEIQPVVHDPVNGTVTLWPDVDVSIDFVGGSGSTSTRQPLPTLYSTVLNPENLPRMTQQRGSGHYVIITAPAFQATMATFVAHKQAKGFTVTTHVPPTLTTTAIKSYIQGLYNGAAPPDYILLVGDTDTIPAWTGGGAGSPDTDLPYACMDAGDDWYADMAYGRFPVRNAAQCQAMIDKIMYYENGPLTDPAYLTRACFMASTDNYTITEGTHNWVINNYMNPNGFTSQKLYTVTHSATTTDVTNAFNAGQVFGVYSGHGGTYSWADGPPFSQGNVNALTNQGMYPFVFSFACITGTYTADECFVETWVRKPNGGALAMYGSSVNSYWTEDDVLEKRLFDSIFDENDAVPAEIGPVWVDTQMRYLAQMGSDSTTRRYFEMYNLMGDPAQRFPGSCSDAGSVNIDRLAYPCAGTIAVTVSDCGLNLDDNLYDTVTVTVDSDTETGVETLLLQETDPSSAEFVGSIDIDTVNAAGTLQINPGDTITVTYIDADDGAGNFNVVVTATAPVDCTAPAISNVHATGIQPRSATVAFDTTEPVRGTVYYGLNPAMLGSTAAGSGFSMAPTVEVAGLQDDTTYYYIVEAEDQAGNLIQDDNNGATYTFTTPEVPDFFTELFTSGFDLANKSITFTPNGSVDFFAGCVEDISALPTSWSGHTAVSLGDDDDQQVFLSFGNTVSLYGTSYASFYINANGYLTFGASDWDYTETLDDHFSMPRISALFDDLSPQNGTGVYWAELADRVVVTYVDVPEYSNTGANTFQIEIYFDGRVVLSYLGITASDGLAGLSAGNGIDPDFLMSDLSGLGTCQSFPPTANNGQVSVNMGQSTLISLTATDDGLPNPPGALAYRITTLPTYGTLSDAFNGTQITSVPHTLPSGRSLVSYQADGYFVGDDTFTFEADDGGVAPDGGPSNTATVTVTCEAGPYCKYAFPLDTDPAWTCDGQWQFGPATAGGSHAGDPATAHTGTNVYGYAIGGDYSNNQGEMFLTTSPMDCTNLTNVQLRFWRWLGIEQTDHACVDVSDDGVQWTRAWAHDGLDSINDLIWHQQTLDISAVADNQPTVYVRWGMGTTDSSITYPGWSLDDIELWGHGPVICAGDTDCDGDIDFDDITLFVASIGDDGTAWRATFLNVHGFQPACSFLNGDMDNDQDVDFDDITPFVNKIGTTCGQ
jgi:hypothetical protein